VRRFKKSPPTYSTKRPPKEKDANEYGYVLARHAGSMFNSYSGVKWNEARLPKYDRWCRVGELQSEHENNDGY
jgi:hypothetical protein